jgi:hypothetical protein
MLRRYMHACTRLPKDPSSQTITSAERGYRTTVLKEKVYMRIQILER